VYDLGLDLSDPTQLGDNLGHRRALFSRMLEAASDESFERCGERGRKGGRVDVRALLQGGALTCENFHECDPKCINIRLPHPTRSETHLSSKTQIVLGLMCKDVRCKMEDKSASETDSNSIPRNSMRVARIRDSLCRPSEGLQTSKMVLTRSRCR
jgi:hypothetical protein